MKRKDCIKPPPPGKPEPGGGRGQGLLRWLSWIKRGPPKSGLKWLNFFNKVNVVVYRVVKNLIAIYLLIQFIN